jgi:TM2 domain-containing membrane protein YozV
MLHAQTSFNDSLMQYELIYFKNTNDSLKQEILIKKIKYYLENNRTDEAVLKELKRVNIKSIGTNTLKENFLWNAALVAYLNSDINYARFYLAEYEELKKDTSLAYNLLSIFINKYDDTTLTGKQIRQISLRDTSFNCLSCFKEVAMYNKKHLNVYLLSSAILPGSGSMMNGYAFKGLVSLALTAGSVYGVIRLIDYGLYVNAVLWGSGVGLKFYTGNIKLTESLFYQSETKQKNKLANACELKVKKVLDKYPISLKVQ